MSAPTVENVIVGESGDLWTAPAGTAAPTTTHRFDPNTPWVQLGYVTDAGATVTCDIQTTDITAWQAGTAIRRLVTSEPVSVGFELMQFDPDAVILALRGGAITGVDTDAVAKFSPPSPGSAPRVALYLTWIDEGANFSMWFPNIQIAQSVAIQAAKANVVSLPINAEVLDATPDKFNIFSDHDAWVAAIA